MRFTIMYSAIALLLVMCSSASVSNEMDAKPVKDLEGLETAYFASGCFWCVEAVFESVYGVEEAISGYAGGTKKNPTYQEVGGGRTDHAEAVEVYYDPTKIDFRTLVKVFYGSQDPTTVNGQHPDYGRQYRSIIFFQNEEERMIAEEEKKKLGESGMYDKPIATEISELTKFWKAEDYHQDFERLNPNQSYVRAVSVPRLNRFKSKFPELLKEKH
ncbi:MAG: peptide-methionine (S)-S-oxide reductase MsrA [Flavobacteriales bacterium]|nr:peptide-methionine (S)-S-oxide reductase MsrA [Flavobacteriales bacterium]MDG1780481.1 peptide-methionine (S)-S-oxide reductase MsrA [Flavobacteriales bacterium]MDG2246189.1 peptide-methionine (S)-S-oxide reductase MsrA [Flavobacteriales bacterium]